MVIPKGQKTGIKPSQMGANAVLPTLSIVGNTAETREQQAFTPILCRFGNTINYELVIPPETLPLWCYRVKTKEKVIPVF
jgi:hypothetical protein